MTHRTESSEPSPVELATVDVVNTLRAAIDAAHQNHRLALPVKGFAFSLTEFKKMLALYFHDKSLTDWCQDFAIPDATDPSDRLLREHGGEG